MRKKIAVGFFLLFAVAFAVGMIAVPQTQAAKPCPDWAPGCWWECQDDCWVMCWIDPLGRERCLVPIECDDPC